MGHIAKAMAVAKLEHNVQVLVRSVEIVTSMTQTGLIRIGKLQKRGIFLYSMSRKLIYMVENWLRPKCWRKQYCKNAGFYRIPFKAKVKN